MTEELEGRIDLPESLENKVYHEELGKKIEYAGHFASIRFYGSNLTSAVYLSKREIKNSTERKKKRISWFPYKVVNFEEPVEESERIWSIGYYYRNSERSTIIENGQIQNSREHGYRAELIGEAANSNLLLSDKLLDEVFSSMEQQLLEIYKKVVNFGK